MVKKELVMWIKSEKAQGYSNEQLRQILAKRGHNERDIEEALSSTKRNSSFPFINQKAILIVVSIIFILLVGYSIYMLNLESYMDNQNTLVYGQSDIAPGSEASLRIVALNHKNAEPISGAEVTIVAKSEITGQEIPLFSGETGKQGSPEFTFEIPEDMDGEYDLVVTTDSRYGKDQIIKPITIEREYKILLTTDKPLYQPGQIMHIRALALEEYDSKPVQEEVIIEVEDSKGNKVFKKKIDSSKYGVVGTNFTLANEINYGRYTIRASIGDYSIEKKVEVKKYVLPKFKVGFNTEKSYYLPDQELIGTVSADYFFGKPANNAEVNVKVFTYEVDMKEIGNIKGMTDSSGVYRFDFDLPSHFVGLPLEKGSGLIFFNISVTDQAGHTEEITSSVPIAKEPIEIELIPESGKLEKNIENIIYVITTYPNGKPAPSVVTVKGKQVQTNSHGIGEFSLVPDDFFVEIQAIAKDNKGNTGTADIQFPRDYVKNPRTNEEFRRNQRNKNDGSRTESVLLRVKKSILNVGDTLHLDVFYTGDSGTVYLDVIKNKQTILTKALEVTDGQATLELDIDESMYGTLELHAYKIMRNSDIVRDTKSIFVNQNRDIQLDIKPGKDSYLPGEEAEINFYTTKNNSGIPTAIGINIVDESVFALQEKSSGFEKLYFELEEELMQPRYVIYGVTLPSLIYNSQTMVDEQTRTQAGNILMAAAEGEDRFSLKASSRVEMRQEIERKKDNYFSGLFKFTKMLFILIPLLILGLAIYDHRKQKKKLLKNFGLSVLLILGTFIVTGILFWIITAINRSVGYRYRDLIYSIEVVVLFITLLSTIVLSARSRKKDQFKTYFLSTILIPIQIVLVILPLTEIVSYRTSDWIANIVMILLLLAIIYSFVVLIKYAKKNDSNLFWITLLILFYMLSIPVFILLGEASGLLGEMVWVGGVAFLIPIIYGLYTIYLIRLKNKVAVPALFIALLIFLLPIANLLIGGMIGGATDKMRFNAVTEQEAMNLDDSMNIESEAESSDGSQPRVRQFFPETLYSNPQLITDNTGKATLNLEMADSITSWRITALANSLNGDIGSNNAEMIVFQDFFVDIDLPISLTQGDEVSIPVSVFNYLNTTQSVRLEFQEEEWFELLDDSSKALEIGANDIDVVHFRIKAEKLGDHKLTVYAYGDKKNDAISKVIEIIPDGKEFRISHSDRLEETIEKTISVPSEAIDDSENLFIKIYPGLFSQLVEGLDSMFRMPHGCFEQTSSITYPNLLVLDYMKRTNQINPEIQFKAEQYIGTGYQRLMSFESNTAGGWTWFGPPEKANLLLSAYGLMEFYDMANVYEIDDSLIDRTQDYLVSQMGDSGSFEPEGRLHTSGLKVQSNNMTSTCFVAWSLAYTGYDELQKTVDYIDQNIDLENEGSYTLALCGNALAHYDGGKSTRILKELSDRAIKDKNTMYWRSQSDTGNHKTVMGGQGNIKNMETTALAALAYIEAGYGGSDINKILTYIVNQKDSHGSWGTTFSTIMSLKAMINALTGNSQVADASIQIFVENELVKTINIDEENSDVLQLVELKQYAKKGELPIKIKMKGEGNLFYQIVGLYFVDWEETETQSKDTITIDLDYDKTELKVNDIITAKVNAVYHGEGFVNNAIIDVGIPPGFSVISTDLQEMVEKGTIEKYDVTGRQIIIYVRFLDQKGITINYGLKAKYPIKAKTTKSAVYDYYNPDVRDEVEPVEIQVDK